MAKKTVKPEKSIETQLMVAANIMKKVSIRFYNNREVRTVWNDDDNLWMVSIVDVIASISDSPNPRKYWSVLKTRLKKSHPELTTRCSQLKLCCREIAF